MGNIVAARRLRKSMLKDFNYKGTNTNNLYNLGYCNNDILPYSNIFEKNIECETNSTGNDNRNETKILYKLKNKIILKIFATCLILFLCLTIKLTCKEKVLQNNYKPMKERLDTLERQFSKLLSHYGYLNNSYIRGD